MHVRCILDIPFVAYYNTEIPLADFTESGKKDTMNTAQKFRKKIKFYTQLKNTNENIIKTLPQETFNISIDKGKFRHRIVIGKDSNGKPIRRDINKQTPLVSADYAHRMYLEQLNIDLQREIDAMNSYLSVHTDIEPGHIDIKYIEEFNRVLKLKIGTISEEFQKLLNNKFRLSTYKKEDCIYPTLRGERVRSKSESIIADELFKRGIPYLYEPILEINGIEYLPDFIILDPETGSIYIWEHLGLMEKNDYALKVYDKLKVYQSAGWILGINLITTSETRSVPFTGQNANSAIDYFLCPCAS